MTGLSLRIPGSSANLGPGFDTLGMALSLALDIRAEAAESFSIEAVGRNAEVCAALSNNLILMTYNEVLGALGLPAPALHLSIENGIPLGMGCGSSAAALVAGVMLACHFGQLAWGREEVFREAARREGHPDNVAACVFGGVVTAGSRDGAVWGYQLAQSVPGRIYLALPSKALRTAEARAVLPGTYRRPDAVANIQASCLLVAAFASGRMDLLRLGMRDALHEPFREPLCPLYRGLKDLRDENGVCGVALSGAGPGVLVFVDPQVGPERIREAGGTELCELVEVKVVAGAQTQSTATQ